MSKSAIEWTEHTWNPIAGCSVLTPGCTNCYAMKMAARLEAMGQQTYKGLTKPSKAGPVWTGILRQQSDDILLAPLKRKKPTMYFVNSMSDLFHEDCPDEWIDKVFGVMLLTPHHTYQVLTKRAARMRDYMATAEKRVIKRTSDGNPNVSVSTKKAYHSTTKLGGEFVWPLPNVWLGVSTERQQEADERIPLMLQTPAAVRFISAEPLLGPIDLEKFSPVDADWNPRAAAVGAMLGINWVIVGGESGPGARPMHPDWARSLRDQCQAAGVPFFFKQWGAWIPDTGPGPDCDPIFEGKGPCAKFANGRWEFSENGFTMPLEGDGEWVYRLGKKAAGRALDGKLHNGMPGQPA